MLNFKILISISFAIITLLYQGVAVAAVENSESTDNKPITEPLLIDHLLDIAGIGQSALSVPTDVSVHNTQVRVVDGGNHRIMVFNTEGGFLFSIGKKGSLEGEFLDPVGIGSDQSGRIYVADTGNHRIQMFDDRGRFLLMFPVISDEQQIRPIDVAVDQELGAIYVSGNNNHKIMMFNINGQMVREWGINGAEKGEFRFPATIDLLSDGRIGVVDILNTRVQVFESSGEFSIQIGDWGVLPGSFFRPKGVAIDEQDRIYVSDSYMNVVQAFSDSGRLLYVLRVSDPEYALTTPTGLDIFENRLYVVEMMMNKVSVFKVDN